MRSRRASIGNRISIHALRVEGDVDLSIYLWYNLINFYPRPPGGGRRVESGSAFAHVGISIHALRVEGDCGYRLWCS